MTDHTPVSPEVKAAIEALLPALKPPAGRNGTTFRCLLHALGSASSGRDTLFLTFDYRENRRLFHIARAILHAGWISDIRLDEGQHRITMPNGKELRFLSRDQFEALVQRDGHRDDAEQRWTIVDDAGAVL